MVHPPQPRHSINGVTINQFEYRESGILNQPSASSDQVSVVVAGTNYMTRQMGDVRSSGLLKPSDVTIVPRETASTWMPRVEEHSRVLHLTFLAEAWSDLSDELSCKPEQLQFKCDFATPDPLLMQLVLALFTAQNRQTQEMRLYLESLSLSLKLHVLRFYTNSTDVYDNITNQTTARFSQALGYIRDNLSADLSLAKLASLEGLSVYHFSRTFRAETGLSPRQFIINERVSRAKRFLKSSLSISEVAQRVGFANQSHFTHYFKRVTGQTPNQFRNS